MKVFVLLVLVTAAFAQQPRPCESPRQWEGRVATTEAGDRLIGQISYDEENRRIRIIEDNDIGSTRSFYDTIYLHNSGKEYRIDLKTRQCNVTALTRPFRPFGVPMDDTFEFETTIGDAGVAAESPDVAIFAGTFSNGDMMSGTVTFPGCIPIETRFFSQGTGLVERLFYDITIGIANLGVFIPPSKCTESK